MLTKLTWLFGGLYFFGAAFFAFLVSTASKTGPFDTSFLTINQIDIIQGAVVILFLIVLVLAWIAASNANLLIGLLVSVVFYGSLYGSAMNYTAAVWVVGLAAPIAALLLLEYDAYFTPRVQAWLHTSRPDSGRA